MHWVYVIHKLKHSKESLMRKVLNRLALILVTLVFCFTIQSSLNYSYATSTCTNDGDCTNIGIKFCCKNSIGEKDCYSSKNACPDGSCCGSTYLCCGDNQCYLPGGMYQCCHDKRILSTRVCCSLATQGENNSGSCPKGKICCGGNCCDSVKEFCDSGKCKSLVSPL